MGEGLNHLSISVTRRVTNVNLPNCIIKNLYEIDSLHHLKIYTKESGTVSVKTAGGSDEVNGKRETESDKDHSGTISESIEKAERDNS